jgi:hypothetical protein
MAKSIFFSSNDLQLSVEKSGWKLIFGTPTVGWIVKSKVLLEVHGSSKGKMWKSQFRDFDTFDEKTELIEGLGLCRIISFEGVMERYLFDYCSAAALSMLLLTFLVRKWPVDC